MVTELALGVRHHLKMRFNTHESSIDVLQAATERKLQLYSTDVDSDREVIHFDNGLKTIVTPETISFNKTDAKMDDLTKRLHEIKLEHQYKKPLS